MLINLEKAYIAGFLDGDGCIMFQLVRKKDYVHGFQIRASIVFYQKLGNEKILKWIKSKLKYGYIRNRKDNMVEYTIVGRDPVNSILKLLHPYLRIKRKHTDLAFQINKIWPKKPDQKDLLEISKLVDKFQQLNYSKKRTNTSKTLEAFFKNSPRND